jgi:hypothetical protein
MDEYIDANLSPAENSSGNMHVPLALLAFAFSVFLFAQISGLSQNGRSMRWQSENLDRQNASLLESDKNLGELIKQRETIVEQSQQIQTRYTEMLNDILKLADTDADTRSVVEKYKIQRQQAPAGAAPTPKTAP